MELHTDYKQSTLSDVPSIVQTIQALRTIAKASHIVTTKTQSAILRQLAPEVLIAVARQLQQPEPGLAALSGNGGAL